MNCIVCDTDAGKGSLEHIVAQSLGNDNYVLHNGEICLSCNTLFSKFEGDALRDSFIGFLRVKNAVKTKKGKPAMFSHDGFVMRGSEEFKKDTIRFNSLDHLQDMIVDPETGARTITILDFPKTAASGAKMFLKVAFEALYKSQYSIFKKYLFTDLRAYLLRKDHQDWPFIRTHFPHPGFKSIPTSQDKYLLGKAGFRLEYMELNGKVIFHFTYYQASYYINMIDRTTEWIKKFVERDHATSLYPYYFGPKLNPYIPLSQMPK
jgi:hypothetical protein